MPVGEIVAPIVFAVLRVAVVAVVGFALARRGILHSAALADLSSLVIRVAAPSLIFTNAAAVSTGFSTASTLVALAASPLLLGFGCLSGLALCRLAGVNREHRRAVVAASTFQNSAYLPIAVATGVLPALAAAFPIGSATASVAIVANGLIAISLFGALFSPLFWGLGLWWITEGQTSGEPHRFAWLLRLFPPAVLGVLLGYFVGLTPLHLLLTSPAAPLHFLFQAVADVGSLTIPLANLILGGMLALSLENRVAEMKDAACAVLAKLILTPALTLLLLWACRGWWKGDAALSPGCLYCSVTGRVSARNKSRCDDNEGGERGRQPDAAGPARPAPGGLSCRSRADAALAAGLLPTAGAVT